jgi:hypothetical protein
MYTEVIEYPSIRFPVGDIRNGNHGRTSCNLFST